ncbi:MAG: hypothetical protein RMJ37_02435 [Spirochaetia bacterium]|nr:hypothetical protein [Spirochaetota bacterium]MCX8096805.1 hypothetical protein [Spirochaetota bacterium]MDW8112184.1 hypothetical protein [Spirochaetia bacterium]
MIRIFFVWFLVFDLLLLWVNAYSQTVVYYDPDGNLRRIVDINSEGSKLFSKVGLKFVVTADENSFNNAVKQYSPEYFILNSIIYQTKKKSLDVDASFVFERNKKVTYTKRVVTFQEGIGIKDLGNSVLASSFRDISDIVPIETRVLKVPKDLDALLAMKFKQADFALVSESSIDVFKSISPVDFGLLKVVYTSREIYNPVFCYVLGKGSLSKVREVERLLLTPEAKQFLSLMLFDSINNDPKIISKVK